METKGFFQFKIIIKCLSQLFSIHLNTMLLVYEYYTYFPHTVRDRLYTSESDTSKVDPRTVRVKARLPRKSSMLFSPCSY